MEGKSHQVEGVQIAPESQVLASRSSKTWCNGAGGWSRESRNINLKKMGENLLVVQGIRSGTNARHAEEVDGKGGTEAAAKG